MAAPEFYTTTCKETPRESTEGLGPAVRGYDFSDATVDYRKLLATYRTTGFQASSFAMAVEEINKMVRPF